MTLLIKARAEPVWTMENANAWDSKRIGTGI